VRVQLNGKPFWLSATMNNTMEQIPSTVGSSRSDAQEMTRHKRQKVHNNPNKSVALTFRDTLDSLGEWLLTLRQTPGW
jgi:hypothetical protein